MKYMITSGLDVGKKRYEAGDIVTKQELGKSFKWLAEQGIVVDEKEMERARNEKGHFIADNPDTDKNEAWVKKEEEE
mgnify:FL=1